MTELHPAATALNRAVTKQGRSVVSLQKGRVGFVDTSKSPNLFTIGDRKMTMLETGETIAEGDVVAYLVIGPKAVGLGKLIDD